MKRLFPFFTLILVTVVFLSSCNLNSNDTENLFQETLGNVGAELRNDTDNIDTVQTTEAFENCIARYGFYSLEDFKTYCLTGSKDLTLYKSMPKGESLPLYKMSDGAFVDVLDLFPSINAETVTIDYIETASRTRYSVLGYTNKRETPFCISVRYTKDTDFESGNIFAQNDSKVDIIKYEDYFKATEQAKSEYERTLFVFDINGCKVEYDVYMGKLSGLSIYVGDYCIGISDMSNGMKNAENFFDDEDLRSITCFFSDADRAAESIDSIKNYLKSSQ